MISAQAWMFLTQEIAESGLEPILMTKAEETLQSAKGKIVSQVAKGIDLKVSVDRMEEGMIAYQFSDGSTLMTKGRGKSHQMWTLLPSES